MELRGVSCRHFPKRAHVRCEFVVNDMSTELAQLIFYFILNGRCCLNVKQMRGGSVLKICQNVARQGIPESVASALPAVSDAHSDQPCCQETLPSLSLCANALDD